jgi:hypothetical protein
VSRSVGVVKSTVNQAITWVKKHNQVIGKIGSILSSAAGALAIAGLVIAPIPGLDFLTPVLEGAAVAASLGALAAQGVAKAAGDQNITYGDLLGDALGVIPGGADAEDAAQGLNTASRLTSDVAEDATGSAGETFYRTMSDEHFASLKATGRVQATKETFISPTAGFSAAYDGTLVRFTVRPGTGEALGAVGVRDTSKLATQRFPGMPLVSKGWASSSAFFKGEGTQINIGLGRGPALNIFNEAIMGFEEVPK